MRNGLRSLRFLPCQGARPDQQPTAELLPRRSYQHLLSQRLPIPPRSSEQLPPASHDGVGSCRRGCSELCRPSIHRFAPGNTEGHHQPCKRQPWTPPSCSCASSIWPVQGHPAEPLPQCHQPELICLSLVSNHFRSLAAAELYRNFHIVFPDEDDPAFDSPIDGLAGGLETFVTSEYDYAKHLRDISLDTLSAGDKAETAYKPYLYSVSCGKFLNTLLLLTLRKAKALETLR